MRHAGCTSINTQVLDSRWKDGRIWRRRRCPKCFDRFNTHEVTQEEFDRFMSLENQPPLITELDEPIWAVVGFDGVVITDVTFDQAKAVVDRVSKADTFLTTAEAAARLGKEAA